MADDDFVQVEKAGQEKDIAKDTKVVCVRFFLALPLATPPALAKSSCERRGEQGFHRA